jgi:hypothetical protein
MTPEEEAQAADNTKRVTHVAELRSLLTTESESGVTSDTMPTAPVRRRG